MEIIRGITADSVAGVYTTVQAIKRLGFRSLVRVVLDPGMPLTYYDFRIRRLCAVADVMIQFADSSAMNSPQYRAYADWKKHVDAAFRLWVGYAKYWEVSNEPNQPESFIGKGAYDKYRYALDVCREKGQRTVATYLMGGKDDSAPGCYFPDWIAQNPLKTDLALSSCYPYQLRPDMPQSLPQAKTALAYFMAHAAADIVRLAEACPDAKGVGWGETGGELPKEGKYVPIATRAEICRQFYGAEVATPKFIGGVFYWDYVRDCVKTPDAAETIQTAIRESCQKKTGGTDGEEK